ncbi:unnamed protein product [Meganyctiphanes norvegica]|uniref:Membrane protein BRI3 n=1 Tax=Meganyctiphanes norvegica TaxID=48144 RepID=A0AAV2R584_MEGNR
MPYCTSVRNQSKMEKTPPYNPTDQQQQPTYGFSAPQAPPPSYAPPGQQPQQYAPPGQQPQQYAPPQGQFPQQGQPVVVSPTTTVIVVGAQCPSCRVGVLEPQFTCCGVCLGICFFPLGLLCCWAMREKVCTSCQAKF